MVSGYRNKRCVKDPTTRGLRSWAYLLFYVTAYWCRLHRHEDNQCNCM